MKTFFVCIALLLLLLADSGHLQSTGDRTQTISNIFDIPIQTLMAVSKFLQGTRPLSELIRNPNTQQGQSQSPQYQSQQYQRPTRRPTQYYNSYNSYTTTYRRGSRSRAARIAGLYTASDGSGFKI